MAGHDLPERRHPPLLVAGREAARLLLEDRGGGLGTLGGGTGHAFAHEPWPRPPSDRIAFQRARSRGDHWYGIWTIDIDGNTLTEIVPNDKWAAINPAWSPDGKRLVFASVYKSPAAQAANRTMEADDIYVVSADGSGLMQLTFDETPEWGPCWGRDGRVYFVSRRKGHQNIWSVMPTALTGK
ncbi:MAG: PD40 domain-containing protein [Planctomycetes bacterium]|nr:PD40 domain-containing protein [Planctomycetota bacterium]